jgi:hypothetical protein
MDRHRRKPMVRLGLRTDTSPSVSSREWQDCHLAIMFILWYYIFQSSWIISSNCILLFWRPKIVYVRGEWKEYKRFLLLLLKSLLTLLTLKLYFMA